MLELVIYRYIIERFYHKKLFKILNHKEIFTVQQVTQQMDWYLTWTQETTHHIQQQEQSGLILVGVIIIQH